MFTNATVTLASFSSRFGLEIRRDCAFSFVGKIPTRLDRRIVPCAAEKHVREAIEAPGIVGIITHASLSELVPMHLGLAVSQDPQSSAHLIHEELCDRPSFHWKSFKTRIDPTAVIHPTAVVAPRDVIVGAGTVVGPAAVLCERTIIGNDCAIGPGSVVSCDAFEVDMNRSPRRILKQAGGAMLGDHVEIQSKCTIVRSTFGGFTKIGDETKLDCQIHLAHDCDVGKRVRIAACAEISGRVMIGDDAYVGPNVSISNGITIGSRATVTIGAVVVRDVEADTRVTGNFALPHDKWLDFIRSVR